MVILLIHGRAFFVIVIVVVVDFGEWIALLLLLLDNNLVKSYLYVHIYIEIRHQFILNVNGRFTWMISTMRDLLPLMIYLATYVRFRFLSLSLVLSFTLTSFASSSSCASTSRFSLLVVLLEERGELCFVCEYAFVRICMFVCVCACVPMISSITCLFPLVIFCCSAKGYFFGLIDDVVVFFC